MPNENYMNNDYYDQKKDHDRGMLNPIFWVPYMIFMPHLPLLFYWGIVKLNEGGLTFGSRVGYVTLLVFLSIWQLFSTMRYHLQLSGRHDKGVYVKHKILFGGRRLIHMGLFGMYFLPVWYLFWFKLSPKNPYEILLKATQGSDDPILILGFTLVAEVIYAIIFIWLLALNGGLRIIFGSRNLRVGKRVFIFLTYWIPIFQFIPAHMLCKAARDEYLVAVYRATDNDFIKSDEDCRTRYPLIMVHGIGFRDLKVFNYWGRVPRILKKHGATVYYGHQNAWAPMAVNSAIIGETIDKALKECGTDKVNIIAHSKGGLDSRYLINKLGYADKVASLTTINTPHRGSSLITFLNKLPDSLYREIADYIGRPFELAGDDMPDVYNSSKELDPIFCEKFNEENPDLPGIYYQSYTSVMKNCFADTLLTIPYIIMCFMGDKENDGLVCVESAKWGEYKGLLKNRHARGISHGDMIDLKREDIRGFDILRFYYDLVKDLKKRGL